MPALTAQRRCLTKFAGNFAVKSQPAVGKFLPEPRIARATAEGGGMTRAAWSIQKKPATPRNTGPSLNPGRRCADSDQRLAELEGHGGSQEAEESGSRDRRCH